jgi:hypothetical protein
MHYAPAPVLSNSWRTDASVQVGDGEIKKVSASIDTGVNRVYPPRTVCNSFNSSLASLGIKLIKLGVATDYCARKCRDAFHAFPAITITIGSFKFELYVDYFGNNGDCAFQVHDFPGDREDQILVGAPVVTRVVTRWDARMAPSFGFCHPQTRLIATGIS